MPKIHLNAFFVANPPKPKDGQKVDYFDTAVPGFQLEVRATGKCTYYQRYRDKSGRLRQVRIGPTDSVTLEEARQRGRYIRSQAVLGLDPAAEIDKLKNAMTLQEFITDRYLPFIKEKRYRFIILVNLNPFGNPFFHLNHSDPGGSDVPHTSLRPA